MSTKRDFNKKQGLKYYRKKEYIKSISLLEKALRENKNDYEIYLWRGGTTTQLTNMLSVHPAVLFLGRKQPGGLARGLAAMP